MSNGLVRVPQAVVDALVEPRKLPDYAWPVRMPLKDLRKMIERESRDAIAMYEDAFLRRAA